ncbi:uncharacterized protein LOC106466033 isoform X2 [Limulus polyphemus]|uniref:Uncharacterized protein LOC106466033 isoform X2 n=1 Tax=Limulus polyphemus TaxID=6850 RepID=A0ABM1BGV4_LIMPO|nr:uncharacterized protein LOC106466033 isoform X2 [Limulus polyphemus]
MAKLFHFQNMQLRALKFEYNFIIVIFLGLCCQIKVGVSHIGEKCFLSAFCRASNSYCDKEGICRCNPDYPIEVDRHKCKQGSRYGQKCEYTEQCTYYDLNSYCTQLPYRSNCECHIDFFYDPDKKLCLKFPEHGDHNQKLMLPTAVGISLALASVLCCCLALVHMYRRQNVERNYFSWFRINRTSSVQREEDQTTRLPTRVDNLPSYESVVSVEDNHEEPPPVYEEAIKAPPFVTETVSNSNKP